MILIETYLSQSDIHGIGLFSKNFVKKGTLIWQYDENTTQVFWKKQFISLCLRLSTPAIIDFIEHSYIREGHIYYLNDNTRFINHHAEPNIAFNTNKTEIAIKDIQPGEEITENYSLSYDDIDFSFWDLPLNQDKKELIKTIKDNLLQPRKVQRNFLIYG